MAVELPTAFMYFGAISAILTAHPVAVVSLSLLIAYNALFVAIIAVRLERIELPAVNSYRLQAENMGAAIRGEAPLLLGREDAVGQARVIEALYEAAGGAMASRDRAAATP